MGAGRTAGGSRCSRPPVTSNWTLPAAAPRASARGRCLRALHLDPASVHVLAVEPGDGLIGLLARGHFHEAEATRASGVAVRHDRRGFDLAGLGEELTQTLGGG